MKLTETLELGHFHAEDVVKEIMEDEEYGELITEVFTPDEVKEYLEKSKEAHPEMDLNEIIEYTKEELVEEAEHFRNR